MGASPTSAGLTGLDLDAFMRAALAEAEVAGLRGERPIGAVVSVPSSV